MRAANLLVLLLVATPVCAQANDTAWLRVETDEPTARLVLDGELIGAVPREPVAVTAGTVRVAVVEDEAALWNPRRAETTVTLAPGDTTTVRLALGLSAYGEARNAFGGTEPMPVSPDEARAPGYAVEAVAGGVAVAAAVVSILLKREADRRYDVYLETGDPSLRPGVLRYDRLAGAALAVSALGLGTVAVRLAYR